MYAQSLSGKSIHVVIFISVLKKWLNIMATYIHMLDIEKDRENRCKKKLIDAFHIRVTL